MPAPSIHTCFLNPRTSESLAMKSVLRGDIRIVCASRHSTRRTRPDISKQRFAEPCELCPDSIAAPWDCILGEPFLHSVFRGVSSHDDSISLCWASVVRFPDLSQGRLRSRALGVFGADLHGLSTRARCSTPTCTSICPRLALLEVSISATPVETASIPRLPPP